MTQLTDGGGNPTNHDGKRGEPKVSTTAPVDLAALDLFDAVREFQAAQPRAGNIESLLEQFCAPNYAPLHGVIICEGHGCHLTDVEGRRYLDAHSAYSGANFGHTFDGITDTARSQLNKLTLTSRAFVTPELAFFCRSLAEYCDMEMVLPMNSGVEAVESAVKVARKWGYETKKIQGEAEIITFEGNFHGRTTTIISASDSPKSRDGFGPYTPGFIIVPYGDLESVKEAINKNTVAILVEPIQGEAGIILPPEGFLQGLRELCDDNNVLFIADEIQTGLGRTGRRFACDHENVKPDVLLLGKSLGGGILALSAVVSSRAILSHLEPGTHGSTFSGNPLACAIGLKVLNCLMNNVPFDLARNSQQKGDRIITALRESTLQKVEQIRGRGLFIGIDIPPQYGTAKKICEELAHQHQVLCKDTREYSIRIAPPLIIGDEYTAYLIDALRKVLS